MGGEVHTKTPVESLREKEVARVLEEEAISHMTVHNIANTLLACCPEEVADFEQNLAELPVEGEVSQRNLRKVRLFIRTQLLGESLRSALEVLEPESAAT